MNTIHQLQMERAGLRAEVDALRQSVNGLQAHMRTRKFLCGDPLDGYINTSDVHYILQEATAQASQKRDAAEAGFIDTLKRGFELAREISVDAKCGAAAAV